MNKKNWIWIAIAIVVIVGGVLLFINKEKNVNDKIKVGVVLPLSGDFASYGNDCKQGIEYAFSNDEDTYELYFEDSKGEPKTSVNIFNKLTDLNKVDFIIGDMFSNTTLSMSKLANSKKVLLISPTASSFEIPKEGIYSLSIFPSDTYEASLIAEYATSNFEKVAVLYEKVAAAEAMQNAFVSTFSKPVDFVEGFDSKTLDSKNILSKVKNSNAEAIYLITYTNNAIKIINQLKNMDWFPTLLGQSTLYDPALIPMLKDYKNDFILTGPLFSMDNSDDDSKKFITGFQKQFNKEPNQMSSQGYMAGIIARDFHKNIVNGNYNEEYVKGYSKNFFGTEFKYDNNLLSQTGLVIYKYNNDKFSRIY